MKRQAKTKRVKNTIKNIISTLYVAYELLKNKTKQKQKYFLFCQV